MKLWQIAVLIYAVIYFMLAGIMEADNLRQSYPVSYVAFSMIAQTLVVGGVVLFALEKAPEFAKVWRWLFPLLVLELALSIRENDWRASRTRSIGRVDGCGFRDDRNAFAVEEKGSGGGCRVDHGPRVVIAPVIAASMAA